MVEKVSGLKKGDVPIIIIFGCLLTSIVVLFASVRGDPDEEVHNIYYEVIEQNLTHEHLSDVYDDEIRQVIKTVMRDGKITRSEYKVIEAMEDEIERKKDASEKKRIKKSLEAVIREKI